MDQEQRERGWLEKEEQLRERVEPDGTLWRKVYVGGGDHLENWLSQSQEIAGKDNVRLERVPQNPLACFDAGGEELYRVWVRKGAWDEPSTQ